mgnify:CR=1 FL=1
MGGVDDEDYAKECYALVEELQLKNLIFTGRVDVVQYMQKLDFTILTSISEGRRSLCWNPWQPASLCDHRGGVLPGTAGRRPGGYVRHCRLLCTPYVPSGAGRCDGEDVCQPYPARRDGAHWPRRVDAYFHHEQMLANYRKMYDETAKEYHLE